jgi:hypothetical protein
MKYRQYTGGDLMFQEIYKRAKSFKRKYPFTVAWRIREHCKVVAKHIEPNEQIKYVFVGQKNDNILDIITTYVIVITDRRIVLGQKRLFWGYFFISITSDMFNDLTVKMGLLWGRCIIDTIKEKVIISNLSKSSLSEIETNITTHVIAAKKKMPSPNRD